MRWARILGVALLASLTPSCLSTSLYDWASEKTPRSEVIGAIDGRGSGDALIVRVQGAPGYADGLYLARLAVDGAEEKADELVPVRLDSADMAVLEVLRREPSPRATGIRRRALNARNFVDGFERVEGTLHRIGDAESPYWVRTAAPLEAPKGASFTRMRLYVQHEKHRPESRGVAYLPSGRREPGRIVAGVLVAPVAMAVDIVTFPVQFVVGVALFGDSLSHMFADLQLTFGPIGKLLEVGLLEPIWFGLSCVPMIVEPGIGTVRHTWRVWGSALE